MNKAIIDTSRPFPETFFMELGFFKKIHLDIFYFTKLREMKLSLQLFITKLFMWLKTIECKKK